MVIGPGDLYTSILAVCVVGGVREALSQTKAKLMYISNLMTKYGQTTGMSIEDHAREIERYITRTPDIILANNAPVPPALTERYATTGEYPTLQDGTLPLRLADLMGLEEVKKSSGDVLRRSLVRHDSQKLAQVIMEYV